MEEKFMAVDSFGNRIMNPNMVTNNTKSFDDSQSSRDPKS